MALFGWEGLGLPEVANVASWAPILSEL